MATITKTQAIDVVRTACLAFDIDPEADIEFVKYRENIVFRLIDRDAMYVMRVHRQNHRTDAQVQTETRYLQYLFDAGLAVSEVIPTVGGELFTKVTDAAGRDHQVDAQRWVPDSAPLGDCGEAWTGEEHPSLASFTELGEIAGKFHTISQRTGKLPGFSRDPWDREGLVGTKPLWGDPRRLAANNTDRAIIDTAMQNIGRQLEELGTGPEVYGVIHADFSPENVLLSSGQLTIIDFDDFGEGWWLFDLATVLFWYHRHPRAAEYREALLSGYQQYFSIPEKSYQTLEALIIARGLTYLGWAADRPENETSTFIRSEVLPVVVGLCRDFNEQYKNGDSHYAEQSS